jgi:hypothetical protein
MKLKILNNYWFNLLVGALILSWVMLYNGYPIIYNDTATYIKSGFNLDTPADRPITYGIFILLTSFYKTSLCLTIFFQNLLLSGLLLVCFIKCLSKSHIKYFLATICVLSLFTGLPWVSNQIFADLFTSFIFLSAFLILTYTGEKKTNLYFLYFIFLWAVGSHLSHITITQFFLYAVLPFSVFFIHKNLQLTKAIVVKRGIALIVIGLSAMLVMGSAISKSSTIFFTGKLCENGILKKYLDENCATTNYKLCTYKDELNYRAFEFVWNPKCATLKLGGWKAMKQEYSTIDKAIVTNPKYFKMLVVESMKASAHQFTLNNIGEGNGSLLNDSNNTSTISRFFPHEFRNYVQSIQCRKAGINFPFFNSIYNVCYILFAILFLILFIKKTISQQFNIVYLFALITIMGVTINNVISASLANQIDRFGVRVIWLVVFATILMTIELLSKKSAQA